MSQDVLTKSNITRAVVRFLGAFGASYALVLETTKANDLHAALIAVVPAAIFAVEKLLGPN